MKIDFDPSRLDVEAFVKAEGHLEGHVPLEALQRLASAGQPSAPSEDLPRGVAWRADGEMRAGSGGVKELWVHVRADAEVLLECQRCLEPVDTPVSAERSFLFVRGEEAAAQLDAESDADVLALSRSLDLLALIEDELLLSLPLVPHHEVCPRPLVAPEDPLPDEEPAAHPFAALAALKRGNLPN